MIERLTGVRYRHVAPPGENASDLAAAAAGKLLAGTGTAVADIDLLIFASASQDMMEPATSHIVGARLGARARCSTSRTPATACSTASRWPTR